MIWWLVNSKECLRTAVVSTSQNYEPVDKTKTVVMQAWFKNNLALCI